MMLNLGLSHYPTIQLYPTIPSSKPTILYPTIIILSSYYPTRSILLGVVYIKGPMMFVCGSLESESFIWGLTSLVFHAVASEALGFTSILLYPTI